MTIAVPILVLVIGVALLAGRKSPAVATAMIFTVVGVWLGQTWVGKEIISGLDQVARLIG